MRKNKLQFGFTIIELLVAMALLSFLLVGSGIVFKKAVQSERIAKSTAEITRKLRAITDQIELDFTSLRKDGEIVIVWVPANPTDTNGDGNPDTYERFDRMVFFTSGDFSTYHDQPQATAIKPVSGNLARVCYMLAKNGDGIKAELQNPNERILARTQHILTADNGLPDLPFGNNPYVYDNDIFAQHNSENEFDKSYKTIEAWKNIPVDDKKDIITIALGIRPDLSRPAPSVAGGLGVMVDPENPAHLQKLLCEGVGEFTIQGWYFDDAVNNTYGKFDPPVYRWFPMIDPDGNGNFADSDFILDNTGDIYTVDYFPAVFYPYGDLRMGPDTSVFDYPTVMIDESNFNNIPGLGRALKFTFTLYDSRGIFKDGKTFTHIVYLDR